MNNIVTYAIVNGRKSRSNSHSYGKPEINVGESYLLRQYLPEKGFVLDQIFLRVKCKNKSVVITQLNY